MNNKEENFIYNISKKIEPHQSYNDSIFNSFEKIRKERKSKRNSFKLAFTTVFCSLFLMTGIVLAKDIDEFFQGLLCHNKGLISAIENDFVETNSGKTIESNNVKAYIDSVLMDDYKLCISLSFELPSEYAKDNIHRIEIPNIIIYDENNNILCQKAYKEIDNSFFNNPEISENNFSYHTSYSIGWAEKHDNIYSCSYIINSNCFPKSKKIYIKFDELDFIDKNLLDYTLNLSDYEIIQIASLYTVLGKWNLQYELSEKTYSRENYTYKVKNYNDYNFSYNFPEDVVVSNTETRIKFSYNLHNISKGEDISIDKEPYIKTENEILNTTISNHEYIGYTSKCDYTFEVSKFNSTPTMQLIIPIENGKEIILELERIN